MDYTKRLIDYDDVIDYLEQAGYQNNVELVHAIPLVFPFFMLQSRVKISIFGL
jgi:hypothetical protein